MYSLSFSQSSDSSQRYTSLPPADIMDVSPSPGLYQEAQCAEDELHLASPALPCCRRQLTLSSVLLNAGESRTRRLKEKRINDLKKSHYFKHILLQLFY